MIVPSRPDSGTHAVPAAGARVPVLIAGGGPTGLATATELAHQGVQSLVVEPRRDVSWLRPRAKTTSARTMELFRRWGLAGTVRARAPIPVSWSDEAVFTTGLLGREITRFSGCFGLDLDGDDRAAEAGQQVPQPVIEQVLREAIDASPHANLLTGWKVTALAEDFQGVTVDIAGPGGAHRRVRAGYVVGADGAGSTVRPAIGATYQGTSDARPNFNIVFRSPGLAERVPHGPAVHYWVLHPARPGLLGRLDLDGTWWGIAQGVGEEEGNADPLGIVRGLVGVPVDAEIVSTDPWTARMLLADRYASDRIFLAGDAAHLNPPWGGHGFNTGVGDAVNLGWKLAAVLHGWAPPDLLASYETERRPIAEQTIAEAARNMATLAPELTDRRLAGTDADFDAARDDVASAVKRTKRGEFHSLGLVLDYSYRGSPVISDKAGGRLPHRWLSPGVSRYDQLGRGFTLIGDFTPELADEFRAAATSTHTPLSVFRDSGCEVALVRPDQHVAWVAGDPGTPRDVLLRAVGHR